MEGNNRGGTLDEEAFKKKCEPIRGGRIGKVGLNKGQSTRTKCIIN